MKIAPWLLLFLAAALSAGEPAGDAAPPSFGQVAGRVICHDTGQPGRFAAVELLPEHPSTGPAFYLAGQNVDFSKLMASAMATAMRGSNLNTVSGLDGSFTLDEVPAGTYYVIPQLAGYRSPISGLSQRQRLRPDPSTLAAIESEAQKAVVQPGQMVNITIELQRGAALGGTVSYADGTPASGVTLTLLRRGVDGKWIELVLTRPPPVVTDDRGAFRYSGLLAGQYAVKAVLPTTQTFMGIGTAAISTHIDLNDALAVYSGGALRENDISPIELADGSIQDGIQVIFPLHGLATISGRVLAESDQHAVNAGTIELEDPAGQPVLRNGTLSADGTFTLQYVPQGAYILKVTAAAHMKQGGSEGTGGFAAFLNCQAIKTYGSAELAVTVTGDSSGLVLKVPDAQPDPSLTTQNGLPKGCFPNVATPAP